MLGMVRPFRTRLSLGGYDFVSVAALKPIAWEVQGRNPDLIYWKEGNWDQAWAWGWKGADRFLIAKAGINSRIDLCKDPVIPDPIIPDNDPVLFRKFAELNYNDEREILKFANQYGRLVNHSSLYCAEDADLVDIDNVQTGFISGERFAVFHVESLSQWSTCIENVREAILIYDAIQNSNNETLQEHFGRPRFHTAEDVEGRHYHLFNRQDSNGNFPYELVYSDKANPIDVAKDWLWNTINRNMNAMRISIVPDPRTGVPTTEFAADSLLDAIWYQLHRAVVGQKQYRSCKCCGSHFEVSRDTTGKSKRRKFCKDACRAKFARDQKATALSMRADGHAVQDIARHLKKDIAVVRRMLAER